MTATTLIGPLGQLLEVRAPAPALRAPVTRAMSVVETYGGRRVAYRAPSSRRQWTWAIDRAEPADVDLLRALEAGAFGSPPWYWYDPVAAATNMLRGDVAIPPAAAALMPWTPSGTGAAVAPSGPMVNVPNLIANPGFEVNTDGWAAVAGVLTRTVSSTSPEGGARGQINPDDVTPTVELVSTTAASPAVTAGVTYDFSIWMSASATLPAGNAAISWLNSSDAVISTTTGASIPLSSKWRRAFASGVAPVGAVKAQVRAQVPGTPTVNLLFDWAVLHATQPVGTLVTNGPAADALPGGRVMRSLTLTAGTIVPEARSPVQPVVPGRTYTASAWLVLTVVNDALWTQKPTNVLLKLRWETADGTLVSEMSGVGVDVVSRRASVTGAAPAGAAAARLVVVGARGLDVAATAAQLTEHATIQPWHQGEGMPRVVISGLDRAYQRIINGTPRADYGCELVEVG